MVCLMKSVSCRGGFSKQRSDNQVLIKRLVVPRICSGGCNVAEVGDARCAKHLLTT